MPLKVDKIAINNPKLDRRVKLTQEQKEEIKEIYARNEMSTRELARHFNVSRRTIQFTLNPNSKKQNLICREKRGGWKQYYDKKQHAENIRQHRGYKKKLLNEGLII